MRTHRANRNLHKSCGSKCSGYEFLANGSPTTAFKQEKPIEQTCLDLAEPPIPLHVLMVLQSDFDKPTKIDQEKTYEKSIPFKMDAKTKLSLKENLPGFLENSFYDRKRKLLQVNCWVCVGLERLKELIWSTLLGSAVLLPCKWRCSCRRGADGEIYDRGNCVL